MNAIPPLPEFRLVGIDPGRCGLDGRRISYMEAGAGPGPPVVLLHGIGSNSTGWRYVLDGLSGQARVIAWNAPGYAMSDNLEAESPTNRHYAEALAAFLDALGVEEFFLAGSSFGSMVAATFAAEYPARVRRLALLGSSRGQKWLPDEERARRRQGRAESIKDGGLGLAETRWSGLLAPDASETAVRLTKEVLAMTNRRGFLQSVQASDSTDVVEFAGRITAPTLIAVGSEDRVNPPEVSRAIQAAIPGSRLVVLPGIGHLPKLEAPAETTALLRSHFLEDR